MDYLIAYLEKQLTLQPSDLLLDHDDRQILIGQIELLAQIKEIHENGYPEDKESTND